VAPVVAGREGAPVKSEPSITVTDVTVEREGFRALFNVSFHIGPGNLVGVVGPNGAGKSTLFDAIVGVLPLARGTVKIDGIDDRPGGIAYVPQRDYINMRFPATVHDVVLMGRYCHVGLFSGISRKDKEIVRACLERVGLWERRNALIEENSAGQRQRVFIGRALALNPKLLILDEPTEGIQPNIVQEIGDILLRLNQEENLTILLVEQKLPFARRVADAFAVMEKGSVIADGPITALTDDIVRQHLSV